MKTIMNTMMVALVVVALTGMAFPTIGDDGTVARGTSPAGWLDLRSGTRIAREVAAERLTYSPRWGGAENCTVAETGSAAIIVSATEEGEIAWTPHGKGAHLLTHKADGEVYAAQFTVLGDDVVAHGGIYGTNGMNATWGGDKTHLVTAAVMVPSDASLTIESGAVVKFMPGTSLTVASGGSCMARGVIFTHINDDTVGGDTLCDGYGSGRPAMGEYTISGNIIDDDSTEYRYLPPQVLARSISSDTWLRGYSTYIVSNSVAVASGVTLTVLPGAILKFNSGCSLTVNGTLDAQGTRAEPIIFTSLKDDAHGGDTNGDGNKTYAQAGDWATINAYGTLKFNYTSILYGGNNGSSTADVFLLNGGNITFDNSTIEHAYQYAVGLESGSWTMRNSVFFDFYTAFRHFASCTCVNSVFYDFTYLSNNGGQAFKNCIISRYATALCWWTDNCTYKNCVIWNPEGIGPQSSEKAGFDGNIWGDPLFIDPDNGDFRIAANSPCVDAGDGMVAPETDYYGRPRMDVARVTDTGKPNADGICPDIGLYEVDGKASILPADLAVVGHVVLNAPSGGVAPGDTITLVYTITNCGATANVNIWHDTATFFNDVNSDVRVSLSDTVASMPSNGPAVVVEKSVRVPALVEGEWRVRVSLDVYHEVFEQSSEDNNNGVSETSFTVSLPTTSLSETFSGTVAKGESVVRKFAAPAGAAYALEISVPVGATVFYGVGVMPSSGGARSVATVRVDGRSYVSIPAGETVYVEVSGDRQGTVTMRPFAAGMTVQTVSPAMLPQSGEVTLNVSGLHLGDVSTVCLVAGSKSIAAESVRVESSESLTAKFDCSKLAAGTSYALTVETDAASASLPNAVTVAGVKGEAKLYAKLDMPSSLRQGRSFVFYIDYGNEGNIDMPAPIFTVKSDEMIFTTDYGTYTNSVKVIGLGAEGSAGVLKPGEEFRMAVKAKVKTTATGTVSYTLNSAWVGGNGADDRLSLASFFSEDYVYWHDEDEQEEYDALAAKMGATWAEFYKNLGDYLTYLDGYGLATTDYEVMSQDFAWHCVIEVKEEKTEDGAVVENVRRAPSLKALSVKSPAGESSYIDSDGETFLASSYLEKRGEHWTPATSSLALRIRLNDHHAELARDNSNVGDVWIYVGNGAHKWYKLVRDSDESRSQYFDSNKPTVLICHGNLHSVHSPWVNDMAAEWKKKGVNALAIDWGDASTAMLDENIRWLIQQKGVWESLGQLDFLEFFNPISNWSTFFPTLGGFEIHLPERAFATAVVIPAVSRLGFAQLVKAKVAPPSLTIIGHSHGGHVGGNIAGYFKRDYGKRIARLIGLETSSMTPHTYVSDNLKFPKSWNANCAEVAEFYKSSYWMSMGSFGVDAAKADPRKEQVWADYNFMLVGTYDANRLPEEDHFEHQWLLGKGKNLAYSLANWLYFQNADNAEGRFGAKRHDTVEEWFIDTIRNTDGKWDNLGYNWAGGKSAKGFGMPENLAVSHSAKYHGVINTYQKRLELARPKDWKGEWRYEEQVLNGLGGQFNSSPPLDILQDNVTQAIEYRIENQNVPDTIDDKTHKVSFTIANAADNMSIDYNDVNKFWMMSRNEAHAPWQKHIGVGVWLCRLKGSKELPKEGRRSISELTNSCDFLRIKNWKIDSLERFTQPQRKSVRQFSLNVPPRFHNENISANGEDFLLVIGVGVSSKGDDEDVPQVYSGDLDRSNNWFTKVVKVKPTNHAVIVINGNEYEDGDMANIQIGWNQTSVALSISAISEVGMYGLEYEWNSRDGWFANNTFSTTSWTLPLSSGIDSFETELSLMRSKVLGESGTSATYTIPIGTDSVRVRLVRKPKDPPGGPGYGGPGYGGPGGPGDPNGGGSSGVPQSCDPNEMVGDPGVGDARYVKPGQELTYTIFFENKTNALAAAQFVTVENPLSEWLDWSTFEMGDVGFGLQTDTGLVGFQNGTSDATMDGTNLVVRTEVELDEENGVASWFLRIVSPYGDSDGWPYANDPTGFLPPNDPETHCGEGHLTYRIKVRDDAPANVVITNSASIVFDYNDPIETDPAWWNTVGSLGAQFAASDVEVDEGGTAEIRVSGGSADKASSVQVFLTYNTAAAADLDLAKGMVDSSTGSLPVQEGNAQAARSTNLKFPLTLSWAAGEIGEKVITIPVKADKTVEDDEFFTLQLATPNGLALGDATVCTVTIRDKSDKTLKAAVTAYKPKKGETVATNSVGVTVSADSALASGTVGGFVAGTGEYTSGSKLTLTAEARPGWAFKGWRLKNGNGTILSDKTKWQISVTNDAEYEAVFEQIPYVRGLADPADGGKVTGSGLCDKGKKVTLKATANKNFTFMGWREGTGNEFVATTASLVIDRTAKPAANSKTSTTITGIDGDVTYYAVFKSYPEVFVTVDATDGKGSEPTGKGAGKYVAGTIIGMGKYAIGKTKIAIKAAANKGYVFSGWYDAVGELLTKDATYTIAAMGEGDVEYTAKFITSGEDKAAIQFAVDGVELRRVEDNAPYRTNVWTGVYLEWPVAASALSATTVKVMGLPSGLKFTAKPVTSKVGTGKTAVVVTNVPANTVYGVPTAASKTDRNGKVTPSKVVFTVTTAGKSSQTYQIDMVVDALPAWASGKFDGGSGSGQAQLTVAANGKLSGKYMEGGIAYTLAAGSYSSYEDGSYYADVTANWSYKDGKATVKASDVWTLAVGEGAVGGVVESDRFDAWQNLWSQKTWKDLGTQFFGKNGTTMTLSGEAYGLGEGETVELSIKANGTVAAKGVFGKVSASGSAVVCAESAEPFRGKVFVYFAPNPAKGFAGYVRVVDVGDPDGQ